jgi:hypothetical protein
VAIGGISAVRGAGESTRGGDSVAASGDDDAWLPSRVSLIRGESLGSLCRRLAVANGLSVAELMRMGKSGRSSQWDADRPTVAVARCLGVDEKALRAAAFLDFPTLGAVWRLRTTVWVCRCCQSRGVEEALRGLMVQFSCLRCGTYLVREHDEFGVVQWPVDPADEAFQREILGALTAGGGPRLDNAIHLGFVTTDRLVGGGGAVPETRALLSVSKAAVLDCLRHRSTLPEHPRIVAFILRRTWIFAASEGVTNIAQAALGRAMPRSDDVPGYFDHLSADELAPLMRGTRFTSTRDLLDAGLRIAAVVATGGLRSVDVPWDVRYARDHLVIDDAVYRWRLYVCLQLRYWLKSLELNGRADPFDDRVIDPVVLRSSRIVGRRADTAAIFLAHLVQLAEDLTTQSAARHTSAIVPDLDVSILRDLAPSFVMRTRRRAVRIARYWMWLDLVAGHDAYGYLPTCSPPEVRLFEELVGERERAALRRRGGRASGPASDR